MYLSRLISFLSVQAELRVHSTAYGGESRTPMLLPRFSIPFSHIILFHGENKSQIDD